MPLLGDGYEVMGVTLLNEPPIGVVDLELDAGVTALYGLNGAGKSTVLNLVDRAFAGEPTNVAVLIHVRLPDAGRRDSTGLIGKIRTALHDRLTKLTRSWLDEDAYAEGVFTNDLEPWAQLGVMPALGSQSVGELTRLLYEARIDQDRDADADTWDWMIDDVLERLHLVLYVTKAGWTAHMGTTVTPGSALARDVDAIADHWRAVLRQDEGVHVTEDMPWIATLWGARSITLRTLIGAPAGVPYALPPWAAVDLLEVGPLSPFPIVELLARDESALDDITRALVTILEDGEHVLVAAADDEVIIHPEVLGTVREVESNANRFLSTLLEHAPTVHFELGGPEDWLHGRGGWRAVDPWSGATVELDALSRAQRRYSELAIRLALHAAEDLTTPLVFVQDEPESGLHRSAEEHLMDGLTKLIVEGRSVVSIVATHSAAALNNPRVHPVHVVRGASGRTELRVMPSFTRDHLHIQLAPETLGVPPATLLQMIRVFVCVEGLHDEAVLEGLFSSELDQMRAQVVRMSGASNTKAVIDAQLIFQFTSAPIVVVLDNISQGALSAWEAARAASLAGEEKAARRQLELLGAFDGGEAAWLRELGERCLATGTWHRVHVFGLSLPDIVCYLPSPIVGAKWDDLIAAWRRSSERPANIKEWVEREHGTRLSIKSVRAAVKDVDTFHPDLVALQAKLQEVAAFGS